MATNNKALVDSILKNTKQITDFQKILSFGSYFSPELAPQLDTAIQGVRQDFSRRGLGRSGLRGQAEQNVAGNIADQANTQAEQLYANREQQARQGYADLQGQYEKAPTTYKGPKGTTAQPYTVTAPQQYETTKDIYGGLGTQRQGGFSYLQAYRDYLKKQSPDYYSKYYGA
jgi:hypothetical protein